MSAGRRSFLARPLRFSQPMLISTNATNTQPAWTPGTYALGAQRLHTLTPASGWMAGIPMLRVVESLADGNTAPPTDATQWLDVGPANTVAMFASRLAEKTTRAGGLLVVLAPDSLVDVVALFGVVGSSVTVRVKTAGGVVKFSQTETLAVRDAGNWFDWFHAPFVQRQTVLFRGLLALPSDRIEIELTGPACAVGRAVFGQLRWLGTTPDYGATWAMDDYSSVDPDEFGRVDPLQRDYAPRLGFAVQVDMHRANEVNQLLIDLRGTPTLFVGTELPALANLTVLYGLVREPSMPIAGPTYVVVSAEMKGFV